MQITSPMLTPEQIKRLANAGVTVEQLAVMVEIMTERDAVTVASLTAPKPKSKEALRSKAYRERLRAAREQAEDGSSVTPSRSLATTKVSGGDRDNNNSLQEISEKEGKRLVVAREAKRGTRIPTDFEPDDSVKAIARELHFTQREWNDWLAEFKDFWSSRSGRDATKTDWQATARNGIRRFDRHSRKAKANGYNTRDSIDQAFDYIDRRDASRRQDGGQENPELLPRLREASA